MAPTIQKYGPFNWDKYNDWSAQQQEILEQQLKEAAKQMAQVETAPVTREYISIRVETIENGYVVRYSGAGLPERIRYAENLTDVGKQITVAAVEMKLRGAQPA